MGTIAAGTPAAPASSAATPGQIAWRDGVADGGIDAAFAQAAAAQRPLFLYWGAAWCPPCNRVKADIFARDGAATLTALAQACPQADTAARLSLLAQAASGRVADVGALLAIFTDARLTRANMDLLNNSGIALIKAATEGRTELLAALSAAARAWSGDLWLGAPDRLSALRLQLRLSRLDASAADLSERLGQQVAEMVVETLAASSDPYERHTLVNTAVSALHDAGLPQQAEALLLGELPGSHSPYYFMLSLAANAKRRGDTAGVLNWYALAAASATGPATRLQWGTTYLASLIDLAPQDSARIDAAAAALLRDIAATPDAFQQRNRTQLQRAAAKLAELPQAGEHASALSRAIAAGLG